MSRIAQCFARLRKANKKALVAYLTAADPNLEASIAAAKACIEGGADILEIGVPFSDPVADGAVIQRAMIRALQQGDAFGNAVAVVEGVRRSHADVPIVVFGYVNPLLWDGIEASCARLREAGADGILVVDVPGEEAGPLREVASRHGLDFVSLVAPTTGIERAKNIAKGASGFLYLVSMTGVTGGAISDLTRLNPYIEAIASVSDIPVCVGFGVRDRASAARVAAVADGVVVGSALVSTLEAAPKGGGAAAVRAFVEELRAGV